MLVPTILETIMLVCFAVSWPAAVYKSWISRTTKGKSLVFLIFVLFGYVAGISKVLYSDGLGGFLLIPYTFNFIIIFMDFLLYFRNARLDRMRAAS